MGRSVICNSYSLVLNKESYMSTHVLLNLLNELGKRDKMEGLLSILSLFRNEFNKFNNKEARMLDFIYHMTLKLIIIALWSVNVNMLSFFTQRCNVRHYITSQNL